jgi:hypothetical protein
MRRPAAIILMVLGLLTMAPGRVHGQATAAPRRHSLELAGGFAFMDGIDFGSRDANLTANDPGDPGYPLFHAATKLGAGTGVDGRIAFNVTRTVAAEGGFLWVRQTLRTRITGDIESAPNTTLAQTLDTYFVEGAVVVHLSRMTFANGKGLPFVLAGAAYRRQLDGGQILTSSGPSFDAGGGVKYFFVRRPRGALRDFGVRSDARIYVQSIDGDTDIDGKSSRVAWAFTAGAVFRF